MSLHVRRLSRSLSVWGVFRWRLHHLIRESPPECEDGHHLASLPALHHEFSRLAWDNVSVQLSSPRVNLGVSPGPSPVASNATKVGHMVTGLPTNVAKILLMPI